MGVEVDVGVVVWVSASASSLSFSSSDLCFPLAALCFVAGAALGAGVLLVRPLLAEGGGAAVAVAEVEEGGLT